MCCSRVHLVVSSTRGLLSWLLGSLNVPAADTSCAVPTSCDNNASNISLYIMIYASLVSPYVAVHHPAASAASRDIRLSQSQSQSPLAAHAVACDNCEQETDGRFDIRPPCLSPPSDPPPVYARACPSISLSFMDPIPYNITIPSQTASIQYSPTRDGAIDAGWNVTYPSGLAPNAGTQQGVGADFHQTTHDGATLQLSFTGTAIYLYGQATSASFTVAIDGKGSDSTAVTIPQGGLLAAQTGLAYGSHTVTLTTHGTGLVAFQYAELTIGIGYPGCVTFFACARSLRRLTVCTQVQRTKPYCVRR